MPGRSDYTGQCIQRQSKGCLDKRVWNPGALSPSASGQCWPQRIRKWLTAGVLESDRAELEFQPHCSLAGERCRPSFWEACLIGAPVSGLSGLRGSVYAVLSMKLARSLWSLVPVTALTAAPSLSSGWLLLPFDLLVHSLAILTAPFMHHLRKYYSLNIPRSNPWKKIPPVSHLKGCL